MAELELKNVGDVVRLKHGGPKMTVTLIMTVTTVECSWFVGDVLNKGTFDQKSLVLVTGE